MDSLKLNFQEGDLPSLHPHSLMIHLRGISTAKTLYECLTRINAEGKPELAGAETVEISDDGLKYLFILRDNRWSDGTPVTAYQYEQAWKEALSPQSNCSRADLLYMIKNAEEAKKGEVPVEWVGIRALDPKTLQVELAYPSPYFLELVAQPICAPLVDPKNPEPSEFNGPFLVDRWKHGDYLRLKKNPYFWDSPHISLNQIDIFMVQDSMAAYSMFEKNEIDWIGVPFVPLTKEMADNLEKSDLLHSHPIDRVFWVFLNIEHPSFRSHAIRQALSLAVDRSAITEHILAGGKPLDKPLPDKLLQMDAAIPLGCDLVQAKLKFEEGLEEIGIIRENFPPFVIAYSQQAGRKQLAEYLQETWSSAFGIEVKVEAQEWNVLRSNLEKGVFDVSGCYEAAFYNDPMELLGKMASLNPNNFSRWVDVEFRSKINEAQGEARPDKRKMLLVEAEKILMDQMPVIPVSSDIFKFSHPSQLKGYVFDYVGACDVSRAAFTSGN